MRIGLIRHFKVAYKPRRKWMTAAQFNQWVEDYDKSELEAAYRMRMDLQWDVCLSSDLSRALRTAEAIHHGPIIGTGQLREIKMSSIGRSKLKLHYYAWLLLTRIAWFFSHRSQEEGKFDSLRRAQQFVDDLERDYPGSNVLVVSHGAFMRLLMKELASRRYVGEAFLKPQNGRLYTYERREK